jgi:hypothetical protein
MIDPKLREFATVRELDYIEAIEELGSQRLAGEKFGVARGTVSAAIEKLKRRAALRGYSPKHDMTRIVPDGFKLRGVSSLYNKDGKLSAQWVKSSADDERREQMMREAIAVLSEDVKGRAPLSAPPARAREDLLAIYPLGDPHIGMYAWSQEAGDDFDLDIAREQTLGAVDRLMASAPDAHTAVILPLGDVFHANDQSNATPGHKHQLDVDSRYVRVLQVGIETFRHAILRALEKHQKVIVRFVQGNHDPQAIWALSFTIAAYFSNEPRVEVDLSPSKFWFLKFGKVLIGATHGDTVKHEGLLGVMAADRAEDWGLTKHRYWYTGHVHNTTVKEFPGVVCESFRTLAAKDAYAAGAGYRAGRDMVCIVHHRDHGEVERHRCDVGMLN